MKKGGIKKLKTRMLIFNYIVKHPGLHFRELSRELKIPKSTLDYHLTFLKKSELIKVKSNNRFNRYYAMNKVDRRDKELINILRQEVPLKIVFHLLVEGPGDIYKDEKTFWKAVAHPPSHERLLSVKEIVELEKYWNWDKADLHHINKGRSTIDFHLNKLLKAGIIEKIRVGKQVKYKLKDRFGTYCFIVENNEALSSELIDTMLSWDNDGIIDFYMNRFIDACLKIFHPLYH
jgi:DNA-binding transcriptional ArsR family regulator